MQKWKMTENGHEEMLLSSEDLGHTGKSIFQALMSGTLEISAFH